MKPWRLVLILAITALLLAGLQYGYAPADSPEAPFAIQAGAVWSPGGQTDEQLCVSVSLDNRTQAGLQQVWYRLTLDLNQKTDLPLPAAVYESDPMPVAPAGGAGVSGFSHEAAIQLAAGDAQELKQALRSITVEVFWRGGSQTETFPCKPA